MLSVIGIGIGLEEQNFIGIGIGGKKLISNIPSTLGVLVCFDTVCGLAIL